MFIQLVAILLGLVGLGLLWFGPMATTRAERSAGVVDTTNLPDLVVQIPYNTSAYSSLGEVVWSTGTLEIFRVVVFVVSFLTILALIGEWGEKRILAFLVLMEVLLVLLATLLVLWGARAATNTRSYYRRALCILAAGGADTALALALFMTYFKASGETTLK